MSAHDGTKPEDLPGYVSHNREAGIKWIAFSVALALHLLVLSVNLPELDRELAPARPKKVLVVRKYVPPPPRVEQRQVVRDKKLTRRIPLPDPTPDEPEPIREPEPEIFPEPLPPDVEVLIGNPGPPSPRPETPLIAGVGGVTDPVRIAESYVQPEYPELARIARLEGDVVLQAIVHSDGTVGDLAVLRCTQPGFGFEESASVAVKQWRYRPATQDGRPVEVYFSVLVEFSLL